MGTNPQLSTSMGQEEVKTFPAKRPHITGQPRHGVVSTRGRGHGGPPPGGAAPVPGVVTRAGTAAAAAAAGGGGAGGAVLPV